MSTIVQCIGGTRMVKLSKVLNLEEVSSADVWVKLESQNPSGSYKDRAALEMIEGAERRGTLKDGMTVVEYTGGSTGVSLAMVCAVKGYRCEIVSNDVVSPEKLKSMSAFGAHLTIVESSTPGKLNPTMVPMMMEKAREIAAIHSPSYMTDQMRNPDMVAGYVSLGREILAQFPQGVDAFCACVGTGGMLMGVGAVLLKANPKCRIVALEPSTSAVLSGGKPGPHTVEGVAPGFVPPQFDRSIAKEVMTVSEEEGRAMAVRLAREEGIFAGTSTGLNVVAAIRIAQEMGSQGGCVVTVACDTGLKYLSGSLFEQNI